MRPLLAVFVFLLFLLPASAVAADRGQAVAADVWAGIGSQIGGCFGREDPACAEPLIADLERRSPGSLTAQYCRAVMDFLAGRFAPAAAALGRMASSEAMPPILNERIDGWHALAEAAAALAVGTEPHPIAAGRVVLYLRPGAATVLLPYLDQALATALPALERAFGPAGAAPIHIHIHDRVEDLASVSGLTIEQIHTSGTIALCKYNRVMVTSPGDLLFGYPWIDTVVHELVHWFIVKRGGPGVPVWLHEGLARSFEGAGRQGDYWHLEPDEVQALRQARKHGRLIPFARMSPSMALLPGQDETQLAFAEVHEAVLWLLEQAATRDAAGGDAIAQAGRLVARFGQGDSEAQVIERLVGQSPAQFAAAWRHGLAHGEPSPAGEKQNYRQKLVFRGRGAAPAPGLDDVGVDARRFAELGDRLAVAHRPTAAAIEYRKALASAPAEGPVLVARLVRVLLDIGRNSEAKEFLDPALHAFPDHAPLHVLAARLAVAQGQYEGALASADEAARLNPFDSQLHDLAGDALAALGRNPEAAAAHRRARLVAPQ